MSVEENTEEAWEPMKLRNKSSLQDRRNSVSDIKEFFQSKSTPMSSRKVSGKKDKDKDKERAREAREARESIKAYLENDKLKEKENNINRTNANGEGQSSKMVEHDNNDHDLASKAENATPVASQTKPSIATQTSKDEILKAIEELALKYESIEEAITHPKNGISYQLAKTQEKLNNLHTDVHGAVD